MLKVDKIHLTNKNEGKLNIRFLSTYEEVESFYGKYGITKHSLQSKFNYTVLNANMMVYLSN